MLKLNKISGCQLENQVWQRGPRVIFCSNKSKVTSSFGKLRIVDVNKILIYISRRSSEHNEHCVGVVQQSIRYFGARVLRIVD